jgi:hypothetical protein
MHLVRLLCEENYCNFEICVFLFLRHNYVVMIVSLPFGFYV